MGRSLGASRATPALRRERRASVRRQLALVRRGARPRRRAGPDVVGSTRSPRRASNGDAVALARGRPKKASAKAQTNGGRRIRSEKPLKELIREVLQKNGAAMSASEITTSALAAGWKTSSSAPQKVVASTLGDVKGIKRAS